MLRITPNPPTGKMKARRLKLSLPRVAECTGCKAKHSPGGLRTVPVVKQRLCVRCLNRLAKVLALRKRAIAVGMKAFRKAETDDGEQCDWYEGDGS